jgi:hypothetical protein
MNEQQLSETAGGLADEVLEMAERMIIVGERLHHLSKDAREGALDDSGPGRA